MCGGEEAPSLSLSFLSSPAHPRVQGKKLYWETGQAKWAEREVGLSTGQGASGGAMGDSLGSCAAFPEGEEGTEAGSGDVDKGTGMGGVTSIALWGWSWASGH